MPSTASSATVTSSWTTASRMCPCCGPAPVRWSGREALSVQRDRRARSAAARVVVVCRATGDRWGAHPWREGHGEIDGGARAGRVVVGRDREHRDRPRGAAAGGHRRPGGWLAGSAAGDARRRARVLSGTAGSRPRRRALRRRGQSAA